MSNYHLTSSPCDKQWCAEYPHTHHSPHQGLQISLWQPSGSVGPTVYSSRFKMGRQRERERERKMHGTEMLTQLSLNNSIIKTIKLEEGIFFVTKILIRKKCSVNTCVLCNKKPNNHSIVADRWKKMWRTSRC